MKNCIESNYGGEEEPPIRESEIFGITNVLRKRLIFMLIIVNQAWQAEYLFFYKVNIINIIQ